jgi:hypothetical protein
MSCLLQQNDGSPIVLTVTLDGGEIASRPYRTRDQAVSHAGFLLERLTAEGWMLAGAMPVATLH